MTWAFLPWWGTCTWSSAPSRKAPVNLALKSIVTSLADPGTAQVIPVDRSAVVNLTIGSAGAETNTLAIPTFLGQKMIINADTVGTGTRAITAAAAINQAANTIMTFAAARDCITLEAVTVTVALRWVVTANDGVALDEVPGPV